VIAGVASLTVQPVDVRVKALEVQVARLASMRLQTATIDTAGRRSGTVDLVGRFEAAQIGARVLVTQAAPTRLEDATLGIALFVGLVANTRTLRVAWFALSRPPRRVPINYIVGTL